MSLDEFKHQILPFRDKLYRFSLRIIGKSYEAEDVVQEVFIKIWNDRENMNKISNWEAWCMKLTKNLSIDKKRNKHFNVKEIPENFDIVQFTAGPQKMTELNDTMNTITDLIQTLPESQKMCVQLRDIEGMSYKEIAQILDVPIEHVKVNLHRARKYIRLHLIKKESYGI